MLIGEIQRNEKEKYRISIEEFKGHRFISCRVFFDDGTGKWLPGKQGLSLNSKTINGVVEALREASKKLEG